MEDKLKNRCPTCGGPKEDPWKNECYSCYLERNVDRLPVNEFEGRRIHSIAIKMPQEQLERMRFIEKNIGTNLDKQNEILMNDKWKIPAKSRHN